MTEEKTYVEDIDRSLYDFRYEDKDAWKVDEGLSADIIETISREKNDPEWMREFRLRSLEIYNRTPMVDWGPDIDCRGSAHPRPASVGAVGCAGRALSSPAVRL